MAVETRFNRSTWRVDRLGLFMLLPSFLLSSYLSNSFQLLPMTVRHMSQQQQQQQQQQQHASFTGTSNLVSRHSYVLNMAKKFRNKQAEMAKKMELAKEQRRQQEEQEKQEKQQSSETTKSGSTSSSSTVSSKTTTKLSSSEIKERNDRLRFEELLQTQASKAHNDYSTDGYLTAEQEMEELYAARAGVERLFEGDPAPTEPFEELVSIQTGNALGSTGAKRLVPWLRTNPNDYLIVLCDPRMKSPELRQAVTTLRGGLSKDLMSRLIVINADTPAENRRWLKKTPSLGKAAEDDGSNKSINSISSASTASSKLTIYSDEKMEWMRAYSALGGKRYSMTMFIVADERVQKIARDVDPYSISKVVQNAVKSMMETRRV